MADLVLFRPCVSSERDQTAGRDQDSEQPDHKDAESEQAVRWVTGRELELGIRHFHRSAVSVLHPPFICFQS